MSALEDRPVKLRGWKDVSPNDWADWERRIGEGEDPVEAARARNLSTTAFRKADYYRHQAALKLAQEARGPVIDNMLERRVVTKGADGQPEYREDASDQLIQFHARRWQPEFRQGDKVQVAIGQEDPLGLGGLTLDQLIALRDELVKQNPELVTVQGQLTAGTPGQEDSHGEAA